MCRYLYIVMVTLLVAGCTRHSVSQRLLEVHSLIVAEKYDSAYRAMLNMDASDLTGQEDKAYYGLLMTQTSWLVYNKLSSDSLIDSAIAYYERHEDVYKLADSYYYKAAFLGDKGDLGGAVIYYKKAAEKASQTDSVFLNYKIIEDLAFVNGKAGNYYAQLDYARQALNLAHKMGKGKWLAYSYKNMASAHFKLGNRDSLFYYTKKAVPYIKEVEDQHKTAFLANIASMYIVSDTALAKTYIDKALNYGENSHALECLAYIYSLQGQKEKAYQIRKHALTINDSYPKDKIICNMLEYEVSHGLIDDFNRKIEEIIFINDSVQKRFINRSIQETQLKYDQEVLKNQYGLRLIHSLYFILGLLVALVLLAGYIYYWKYRSRQLLAQHQMLISSYEHRIKELELSGNQSDHQVAELRQKIEDLLERESPWLKRGKLLYDQVKRNENIVDWSKEDFKAFIEYYKAIDFAAVNRYKKKYSGLTPHSQFYLLLVDMGKSNEDIQKILCLTSEGLRSLRHRIKQRKKATNI